MKKIAPGVYAETYKGQLIEVSRVDGRTEWFAQINNQDANDWHPTKKAALEAAKYVIDHAEEYSLELV